VAGDDSFPPRDIPPELATTSLKLLVRHPRGAKLTAPGREEPHSGAATGVVSHHDLVSRNGTSWPMRASSWRCGTDLAPCAVVPDERSGSSFSSGIGMWVRGTVGKLRARFHAAALGIDGERKRPPSITHAIEICCIDQISASTSVTVTSTPPP